MSLLIFLIYIFLIKPLICFLRRSFGSYLPNLLNSNERVYRNIEPVLDSYGVFKATDDRERPVIIKTWTSHSLSKPNTCKLDCNEMSFNIFMEAAALYVLRCLDKFVHQNGQGPSVHCFVYEDHQDFDKWMKRDGYVTCDNSYIVNLFANIKVSESYIYVIICNLWSCSNVDSKDRNMSLLDFFFLTWNAV